MTAFRACTLIALLLAPALLSTAGAYMKMENRQTFEVVWDDGGSSGGGTTQTELSDPLARFRRFPLSDPDGDGYVVLTPAAFREVVPRPSFAVVGDADVQAQLTAFGITKEEIKANLTVVLSSNDLWSDELQAALDAIDEGLWNAAVQAVRGTPAEMAYTCGRLDALRTRSWAIAIPVVLDCTGDSIATEAAAVGYLAEQPSTVGPPLGMRIDELKMNVRSRGLTLVGDTRFVLGAGYADHHFSAYTDLRKMWNATFELHHIDSLVRNVDDFATAYYHSADPLIQPGTFQPGDAFVYGHNLSSKERARTFAVVLRSPVEEFRLNATADDDQRLEHESGLWFLTPEYDPFEAVNHSELTIDMGSNASAFVKIANGSRRYNFGHGVHEIAGTSSKHHMRLDNGEGTPIWDAEIHATYFEHAVPKAVIQALALPDELDAPDSVSFVIDNGSSPAESVASIDVTKRVEGSGWFRSLIVTSFFATSYTSTSSYVDRVKIVSSETDPWDAQGNRRSAPANKPFIMLGAAFVQANLAGAKVETVDETISHEMEMEPSCWGCSPRTYRTWLGPSLNCVVSCATTIQDHKNFTKEGALSTGRFWAIHPVTDSGAPEVDPFLYCGLTHANGACA